MKKCITKLLALFLALVMTVGCIVPSGAAWAANGSLDLRVGVVIRSSESTVPTQALTVRLTALTAGAPMPSQSEVTVRTANRADAVFHIEHQGVTGTHRYRVEQLAGNESGMTYDRSTYTVTVTYLSDGRAQVVAYRNGSSGKSADLVFYNRYKDDGGDITNGFTDEPKDDDDKDKGTITNGYTDKPTANPTTTPEAQKPVVVSQASAQQKSIQTGDTTALLLYELMIILSAATMLWLIFVKRRRKHEEEG